MYHTSRFSGTLSSSDSAAARASAKRLFSSRPRMRKTSDSTADLGGFSAVACMRSNLAVASLLSLRQPPECCLQSSEPWFIIAPLIQALAIDRLPHLLRTCSVDPAFRLVEIDARRFEIEIAEIQDAAHIRLEILDDVFVLYAQYLARKRLVPVRHQVDIHTVIAGDVLDAVGELLPGGK